MSTLSTTVGCGTTASFLRMAGVGLAILLWPAAALCADAAAALSLIPQPVSVVPRAGTFRFTPSTRIVAPGPARAEAAKLVDLLAPAMGGRLELVEAAPAAASVVHLQLEPALKGRLGAEGYQLDVAPDRIHLVAAEPAGLFYGIQTLRQLLPPAIFSRRNVQGVPWTVPCVRITDYPRFGWRGLLIDPARHFIPKGDVFRFIDAMALHKFNRLQIHLTDNEGWRIEIRRYPKLTEVGSKMDWTLRRGGGKGPRRTGFYTQDDIREIVRYAADRHITIVPEIEMPAHTGAAIVAYPRLSLTPEPIGGLSPEKRWYKVRGVVAPRPETVAFMQEVLAEVVGLFPGRHIHIGGDEANTNHWKASDEMQAQMRRLNLKDVHELHSWFIKQMDGYLAGRGRRMIGWDEILQGGLAPGATVMSWRGVAGGITAARAGHDTIMAPTSHTYFDYYQGPRDSEPRAIGGFVPLEKVYGFEPVPTELTAESAAHVLGAQAQLWGEFIPDHRHREYMAFPRACALIETCWSPPENRDYDRFLVRLKHHLARLKAAGIHYRPLVGNPVRPTGKADPDAPRAAHDLLKRLLPDHADRFEFRAVPPDNGRDVFEIETRDGKVVIGGNHGVAMAAGLNWYLKHHCRCHVSWCGSHLRLPNPLPEVDPKVRRASFCRWRYFLNYCCFGYSLPWWDWAQWERLIDWMALNGVNLPLAVTGQEAVWRAVCRELGLSPEQIDGFLAGPPYLPFGWMGCLDGWGGPLPQSWIDRHEGLQQKILARQRALGMRPVLQGFTGHVPPAIRERFPEARLHRIRWIEWQTYLLDPLDPLYPKIAALFMQEQAKRFGTDHLYAADTFIEMTPPSGDSTFLANLSRAIYAGMAETDPQAVWVLQGWTFFNQRRFWTQPRVRAFLGAMPDERMVVLDLFCESTPMWNRTEAFYGKPWVWCNVQNFGCTVSLGGALGRIHRDLHAARKDPASGRLAGVGFVNEGLGYNPVVYDLLFEMAWRDKPVRLDSWLADYSRHRYGRPNDGAERAWQILKETVYTGPHRTRSIIDTVPTLRPARRAPYSNGRLAEAWRRLLGAADELGEVATYRFDLVNVARQVLSNHAAEVHGEVAAAWREEDLDGFRAAAERYRQLIRDLDELLATRREFLLGRWLEDAKRWGTTPQERARFEWNARRVLTLWGTGKAIRDYARREWSGMLTGFYLPRWQMFLDALEQSLAAGEPFDGAAFARRLLQWEDGWANRSDAYPTEPRGDSVAVAHRLWKTYGEAFRPDAVSLTTGKPVTCSFALPPHPAHLANDGWSRSTDSYWATDVTRDKAAWWQVDLERPTTVGRVVVVGYYGDQRFYGFMVETSLDGTTWNRVADRRDNTQPSTAEGYTCRFNPHPVRYIRVTQTHNSANTGRHLVEVMAYER